MSTLSRIRIILISLLTALAVGSCTHGADLWDEMPDSISQFINRYFPDSALGGYHATASGYSVRITDGPGLTFDKSMSWTSINGYGMPLPQVLIYDQTPPALYRYLEESEVTDGVFKLARDAKICTATLLSSTVTCDLATGKVTQDYAPISDGNESNIEQ